MDFIIKMKETFIIFTLGQKNRTIIRKQDVSFIWLNHISMGFVSAY
jgi:hypothetical protein